MADEMLQDLYWLELTALVRREWGVFASIFINKKQFEQHADIVNDRPDAHAKDIDLAEIALCAATRDEHSQDLSLFETPAVSSGQLDAGSALSHPHNGLDPSS
jgi:hypothetical protein